MSWGQRKYVCDECGVEFRPVTWYGPEPRFCGQVCKQRAYRKRKKAGAPGALVTVAPVTSRRRLVTVGDEVEVVAWGAWLPLCGACRLLDEPWNGSRVHRCELQVEHDGPCHDLVSGLQWDGRPGSMGKIVHRGEPVRVLGRLA